MFSCDTLSGATGQTSTYVNEALNLESVVDYFLVNDLDIVSQLTVLDPYINFSDHRPITINCVCSLHTNHERDSVCMRNESNLPQLRWDRAHLAGYCSLTGSLLQAINAGLIELENDK